MEIRNKRVLVTGADGFIGSHLVERLVEEEAEVIALVYYNAWGEIGWLRDVPEEKLKKMHICLGDLRDPGFVRSLFRDNAPQVVFHLGALISIPYSYVAPASYVYTNLGGVLNLLEAAKEFGTERFVHISSSEVYGTARYTPIDEAHPLNPQSPYAATKAGADLLAMSYLRSFELPVVIARPFNTFGPRQTSRAIVPTIITQCIRNRTTGEAIRLGNLEPKRDLTYVKDTVSGIISIAVTDSTIGEVINIGTGESISIKELAELIMRMMDVELPILTNPQRVRPPESEVWELQCDASKAFRKCNWTPQFSLEKGLSETIAWFERNYELYKYLENYL